MSTKNNLHEIKYYRHSSISNPVHNEEIGQDIKIHRLTVEIRNIPLGMSNDNNAREAKLNKAFHKEIKNSLVNSEYSDFTPGLFNLRNSGIVIVAETAYVSENNTLVVDFGTKGSIIDGGHTYKIISSIVEDYNANILDHMPEEYVQVEIITGLNKIFYSEITEARNTSQKHLVMSFESQKGNFEWLKKALDGKPGLPDFSEKVAWYQNAGSEDGTSYPVDAAYILKVLTTCDIIEWPNGGSHPIAAYNSKEKAVTRHKDKKQNFVAMQDIVIDICRLHDILIARSVKWYTKGTVHKIWDSKKTNADKLIFLSGIDKQSVTLSTKILAEALAYPMLAAIRQFFEVINTDEGQKIVWRNGYSFSKVEIMLEEGLGEALTTVAYEEMGGLNGDRMSINHVCKDKSIWASMYAVTADFIRDYNK